MAKILLESGSDVETPDNYGQSPLFMACWKGNEFHITTCHVCMYVCMYVHIYVCTYIYTYICMYACTYVRTYIRTCTCMYVFMCVLKIYIYIHNM